MTHEAETTEIAPVKNNPVAELQISLEDMAADTALGGKVGIQDIGVPFLYILQTNSPQVNPDHPKYIKGAAAGMLYVTVLEKVYDGRETGLPVIPCYYERQLVEWVPREKGGGFVASYDTSDPIKDKAKPTVVQDKEVLALPNGNILQDTAYWYLMIKGGPAWQQLVMPFKSTYLKHSRKWNADLNTTYIPNSDRIAPRWLFQWLLKSQREQRDQYVWSAPLITQGPMVNQAQYDAAKDFAKIAASGLLRRKIAESEKSHGSDSRTLDDDVPF